MTDIVPLSAATATGTRSTDYVAEARTTLSQDFDTFISLLTTQLQNQDPLEPTDPTEFVSQLTQFTELEQTMAQSETLTEVADLLRGNSGLADLGLLGRDVEAVSSEVVLSEGVARFDVVTAGPVGKGEVRLFDSSDRLVGTVKVQDGEGRRTVVWDGEGAADGAYRAEFVSLDGPEPALAGQIVINGEVAEVAFTGAGSTLTLASGLKIGTDGILAVR